MKLLRRLAKRFGYVPATRAYNLGAVNRLTGDWIFNQNDANREIRQDLKVMRERARDLERNNDYVRRYFKLLENNVLGAGGIGLQMKIREMIRVKNTWQERYDKRANDLLELAWRKWGKRANCTVGQTLTWRDLQGMVLRSVARDGAVIIRKHSTGPFGLQLELIEIDQLETDRSEMLAPNEIKLGVEYNPSGQVVAYHMLTRHPGSSYSDVSVGRRMRVPAQDIIHVYDPARIGQATGVPWIHSAGFNLKQLGAFMEAEVIASRAAACKGGWLSREGSEGYVGPADAAGNKTMEMSPGVWEELPVGLKPIPFDPTHPNTAFGDFVKSSLRAIAAGLGVSYVSLANDLEGVNYSSIRAGLLDEREEWKKLQGWFIDWFIQPVFDEWLARALSMGAVADNGQILPAGKFEKFNQPEWKPRRWAWVDPLKDLQASVLAVEKGFTSRRAIIGENGGDIEDTFQDIAADEALEETYGLDFASAPGGQEANEQPETPDDPDDPKPKGVDKEDNVDE